MSRIANSLLVSATILTSLSQCATAAEWAERMVSTKKIDFGVIATGSDAKRQVKVTNVNAFPVKISDTSTTCGCSAATLGEKSTLNSGESTYVEVKMNTSKFRQRKDSNLIIKLTNGRELTEVRIPITAYIRSDVVFKPGSVKFGDIEVGKEARAVVDITYAGRNDWDIDHIKISHKHLKAYLSELERGNGKVKFKLTMTLSKEADVGRVRDLVTIVTNDKRNPFVPLMVDGDVVSDFSFTPESLNVPPVAAGATARVQIVVTGKKPFAIQKVDCAGMENCFSATISKAVRKAHVIPITFNAPSRPGKFSDELLITIAGQEKPLRVQVRGEIKG